MYARARHRLCPGFFTRLAVALLFTINLPLSMAFAAMAAPDRSMGDVPAMSCHESATGKTGDDSRPDPSAALQHLCCFTACIPLAATAEAAIVLALPVGEPLLTPPPMRLIARAIGVDPPPPRS